MAGEMKPNGFYIFDHESADNSEGSSKPGLFRRLRVFLNSRYTLLVICFFISGSLIFYNTAALQLNPMSMSEISETTGVSRQQTIKAARGDIFDATGIPLAYSKAVNTLLITYAGLDNLQLNKMLLDLSHFLSDNGVVIEDELSDYLTLNHSACSHAAGAEGDCGLAVFMKTPEEIAEWQGNNNLFKLTAAKEGITAKYADDLIKTDAETFFDYLLYKKFKIEDPESDGQQFSRSDALRIMQLRYLIMKDDWAFRNGTPLKVARDVSYEVVSAINEQNFRFMGVISGQEYERSYTADAGLLSHVMGYVNPISPAQYEILKSQGYAPDAMVGQDGVESTAERYLAGQDGIKPYNTWTIAGETGSFYSEVIGKDPVPGFDVKLTIDLDLQRIAKNSLERVIDSIRNSPNNKNKGDADAGAVVMIDVKTGGILAMVSYPDYDPNDFLIRGYDDAAADRVEDYLTNQTTKPMLNRAIMENYAPGSSFKPATSIAALESGVITPLSNTIRCVGHEVIAEWPWRCLEFPTNGHGNLTLQRGLATSCNMYFFNLGFRTGIDNIDKWGKLLGLGEYTGIDLPGEVKGIRANRTNKVLLRSNPADQIWFGADTCQTSIGQFDNSFTIIQLAAYTAALAVGNRVTPHVISEITSNDGVVVQKYDGQPVSIGIQESSLLAVRQGMIEAVASPEGTAYYSFIGFPISVAAKTGTAETGFEDVSSSNGLFICYAPADNPQVAIAQIVEKGAWGSNTISIARDLLTEYFNLDGSVGEDAALPPGLTGGLTTLEPTVLP